MAVCPQCNTQAAKGAQFCRSCGASIGAPPDARQVTAPIPAPEPPAPPAPTEDGGIRVSTPVIAVVLAVFFLLAVTVGLLAIRSGGGDDGNAAVDASGTALPTAAADPVPATTEAVPEVTTPVVPERLVPVSAAATAQSGNATDCGAAVTYNPENVYDRRNETAWQVGGDGTGQAVTFDLGSETLVTEVGLIPGYDKVQPCNNRTDRFPQNFRVSRVRWVFDDGTSTEQSLDPSSRALQVVTVDERTQQVRMEILATVPGTEADVDTAISEIAVTGAPA